MRELNEHVPFAALPVPDIILPHCISAGEAVPGAQPVEYTLGCMPPLSKRLTVAIKPDSMVGMNVSSFGRLIGAVRR